MLEPSQPIARNPLAFRCLLPILLLLVSAHSATAGFVDVTEDAGVSYVQQQLRALDNCRFPEIEPDPFLPNANCIAARYTGGVAVADVDGDGFPDLFVTRLEARDLLFHNNGDGTFDETGAAAGLTAIEDTNGAAFADIDNDGDQDLFVNTFGALRYYLYVNDGSGVFTEEAISRGAAVLSKFQHSGTSATFGDYDLDGWPDLYTSEWLPYSVVPQPSASHNVLLRNLGAAAPGHFVDVTAASGISLAGLVPFGEYGLSPAFVDLDGDGLQDFAFVSDFTTSRLFWNEGGGNFVDGTDDSGVGTELDGMGSTFGDFDGDGDLDWFVTAFVYAFELEPPLRGGNRLYRNDGDRQFTDVTDAAGVRDGGWGWGAVFADFDNDGDLDLAQTEGFDVFWQSPGDQIYLDIATKFWRNNSGVFEEVGSEVGITDRDEGRALVTFDFDNDGDLDLFITNVAAEPVLYRNDSGNENSWLRVRVQGVVGGTNADGLGAVVRMWLTNEADPQIRHIGAASHFLGQSERVAHFGLGSDVERVYRVEITWPRTGLTTVAEDVAAGQTLTLIECSDNDHQTLDSFDDVEAHCSHQLNGVLCGDSDRSGSVNASDALRALRAAVGLGECDLRLCDVNGDTALRASDALVILRIAVGAEPDFNCNFTTRGAESAPRRVLSP